MAGWDEDGGCLCSKVDGPQGTKPDLIERSVQCSSLEVGEKDIMDVWDCPGGPVTQSVPPLQGSQVRSLGRELDPTCRN